jgi:uncharacterized lipoprotein
MINIFLKTITNKLLIMAFFTTILSACASDPKQMVLSVQVPIYNSIAYTGKSADVKISDLRNKAYIIAIHRSGKASELIPVNKSLVEVIGGSYKKSLINSGLKVSKKSNNSIHLTIDTAKIDVNQGMVSYETVDQLTLTVKVISEKGVFTKTFNNKGKSDGGLSADLAVLERNFNQNMTKLLLQMVNDSEIQEFLEL